MHLGGILGPEPPGEEGGAPLQGSLHLLRRLPPHLPGHLFILVTLLPQVVAAMRAKAGESVEMKEGYGMTETSSCVSRTHADFQEVVGGSGDRWPGAPGHRRPPHHGHGGAGGGAGHRGARGAGEPGGAPGQGTPGGQVVVRDQVGLTHKPFDVSGHGRLLQQP